MTQPHLMDMFLTERTKSLPASPIRALLSMRRNHDTLDLGGGHPDIALFPSDKLAEVAARELRDHAATSLQYAPTEGLLPLREFIAQRLNERGCKVTTEQVIVTHGSQQALATVASLLTSPTQPVALEQPGYPGALQAFAFAQAKMLALPVTHNGWELDALRDYRPSAMYVIPNFQNPTGRKADANQCLTLARYAEDSGTFLIEDDAYG